MKTRLIIASAIAGLLASASSFAGQFEIWSDGAKGPQQTVIVSFAGDGQTQDAQADITFEPGLEFVAATAKVAGSVCVELKGRNMVRVVPPSGAGVALSSKPTDVCSFSFRSKRGKSVSGTGLSVAFTECAGAGGSSECGVSSVDVSEK